jgi:hypothetical protein
LFLIHLLAGYCGFAQILRSIAVLVRGQPLAGVYRESEYLAQ